MTTRKTPRRTIGATRSRKTTVKAPSRAGASRRRAAAPGHAPASPEPRSGPAPADIAVRAYYLYLERGATEGRALEDWLQAERELAI